MDHIVAVFASGSARSWLVLGLALVVTEVIAPTFRLLWPGLAALAIGLLVALTGPFDWRIQGLLFAILSVVFTLPGRRFMASRAGTPADAPQLNRRAEQHMGRIVRVAETFVGSRGRVRLDDTVWPAHAPDDANPAVGDQVEIVGVEGTVLRVKPVPPANAG